MDTKIHTHCSYAVCDAADSLLIADGYNSQLAANKTKLRQLVSNFFLQHDASNTAGGRWGQCSKPPMQVLTCLESNMLRLLVTC